MYPYPSIPVLADLHTHSISSGHHTTDTITDLARAAAERGLSLLGITDHGPAMAGAPSPAYFRSLSAAPRTRFGVSLLYGVELNILDENGTLDLPDEILSTLDYAAAGIHSPYFAPSENQPNTVLPATFGQTAPFQQENISGQTAVLRQAAACQTLTASLPTSDAVTAAYLHAIRHPFVHIIAHCDDPRFPADYQALVEEAKKQQVLLELNEASLTPGGYRGDTRPAAKELLRWCAFYQHPVLLGSDSHGRARVGRMEHSLAFLAECKFPAELVLNQNPEKLLLFLSQ